MRPYLALIKTDLRLAARDRSVIFFNYLFPLMFFVVFSGMGGAGMGAPGTGRRNAAITNIVSMVLSIGILGNGLWGAGMRLVQERQMNILRRYKVTPLSPMPILVASMITGWIIYMPAVIATCLIAYFFYGMPMPERWLSLFTLITISVFAFRAIGLMIASVVSSTQESTIVIQLVYMPMLFLSGATIPLSVLPNWAQSIGQLLPAFYLMTGLQGVFLRKESLAENWPALIAMAVTIVVATFLSIQVFRWEKEEKLRPRAKLCLLATLAPFLVLGGFEAYSQRHIEKSRTVWRELRGGESTLIRGARIFIGDGRVIESGTVLIRQGKIESVEEGTGPDPRGLGASVIEASGKTLLPGLIDTSVELGPDPARTLGLRLSSGITTVRSKSDQLAPLLALRQQIRAREKRGADLFLCGAVQTAEQVGEFKKSGADCVSVDARRLESWVLREILGEARLKALPPILEAGNEMAVSIGVRSGAAEIERSRFLESIESSLFERMAPAGTAYNPNLTLAQADPSPRALETAREDLRRARDKGVLLVAGSGSRAVEGTGFHKELRLWVEAGVTPKDALRAATWNAARLLRVDHKIGAIRQGYDADLLLVDGDPLTDISATERIFAVIFKGERVRIPVLPGSGSKENH